MKKTTRRKFIADLAACGAAARLLTFGEPCLALTGTAARTRSTVDLGDTPWRFVKLDPYPSAKEPSFDDSGWAEIGVPHSFNSTDTYQNLELNRAFRGTTWYRKRFTVDPKQKGRRFYLEFQSVDIGAAVYINGKFKPGNTAVPQPEEVTHVGCFLPFVLDITDDIYLEGENVLAVRVSNAEKTFFTWPGFGSFLGLGMGYGGIVAPVYVHAVDPIHIPLNTYSPLGQWGTYAGTEEIAEGKAKLRFQVHVENRSGAAKNVALVTKVLDAEGEAALTLRRTQSIPANETFLFETSGEIAGPQLWYPNNSPYGSPHLYRVVHTVEVEGSAVDSLAEYLGVRTITWDGDYCYVNGKKHLLNGFGLRNSYPALGGAVPAELQWNDIRLIAESGGNTLRVGHFPPGLELVAACDAYGVLIIADSGDDEWTLHGEPALTYKKEYDRDMLVSLRNHPSIAVWESNNGLAKKNAPDFYSAQTTEALVETWDGIGSRIVSSRDTSDYWPKDRRIMIGYTANYKKVAGSPSMNMECYYRGCARFDYEHEKEFAAFYVKQYNDNIASDACGWIFWMLAEAMESPFMPFLNGKTHQKTLGSCALDGNRLPKLGYQIFQRAIWAPFPGKPGVVLQSHWNLSGLQTVDAWSNCPKVELFLNGVSQGVRVPDAARRCEWENIQWASGELRAVALNEAGSAVCADSRRSAGTPRRIHLQVEPNLKRPNAEPFRMRANGTDVAIVTATIEDENGLWCPLADQNLRFAVTGHGSYLGSYNFYVSPDQPATYHSPGDPELQAEGGMMRVAVRSSFEPGMIHVHASAAGLESATAALTTYAPGRL